MLYSDHTNFKLFFFFFGIIFVLYDENRRAGRRKHVHLIQNNPRRSAISSRDSRKYRVNFAISHILLFGLYVIRLKQIRTRRFSQNMFTPQNNL